MKKIRRREWGVIDHGAFFWGGGLLQLSIIHLHPSHLFFTIGYLSSSLLPPFTRGHKAEGKRGFKINEKEKRL